MVGHRIVATAFAILALAAGAGRLSAEERKKTESTRPDRLEALATKLGLDTRQKDEVRKIQNDFDKKADPLEQQLWTLHRDECAAMQKTLTAEQRAKLPDAVKAMWENELQKVAPQLRLTDDQQQKLRKIHDEFQPKFFVLVEQKGADTFRSFCELRVQAIKAMRQELNEEQRALLPSFVRAEFHKLHNPASRREQLQIIADKLGVNKDEREQLQKILTEYDRQMEQPAAQLKQVHREEHAAIEKVLTAEQREKWQTMQKNTSQEK